MKKLHLNKSTIVNLTKQELSEIKAGYIPCWENLWTMYYCDLFYTGTPEEGSGT